MEAELTTVFRSADPSAAEDASAVLDALADGGLNPAIFTDEYPGVPPGAVEVRVPAEEEARALELIAAMSATEAEPGDPGHDLDLVEIYSGMSATAELEAMSVRSVLDSYEIPNVLGGAAQIPTLSFVVKVPAVYYDRAVSALAEAEQAGPAAAEEAEQATEA